MVAEPSLQPLYLSLIRAEGDLLRLDRLPQSDDLAQVLVRDDSARGMRRRLEPAATHYGLAFLSAIQGNNGHLGRDAVSARQSFLVPPGGTRCATVPP